MLPPASLALALLLAAAPARPHPAPRARAAAHGARGAHAAAPARPASALQKAEAVVRAVQRDPAKRRYRHEWEKAIRGLERAAKGKDRAPALLAAARARYALYRFSQVEADRAEALRLAARAKQAGAGEAASFAAAVRREAGEDRAPVAAKKVTPAAPVVSVPPPKASPPVAKASPTPSSTPTSPSTPTPATSTPTATPTSHPRDGVDEPPSTDPALDRIIAQLSAEDPAPAPAAAAPATPAPAVSDPALERILEQLRAPLPAPPPREREAGRGPVRRVIVDAGHGGHDTGAIGPSGVREKDVTLAIARRLAARLRKAGFEVVLTRDGDRFLALDERAALANRAHGDVFVSIHANAHPRRDQAGVETYVLDVAHDRYAKRLAARENGAVDDEREAPPEALEVRRILTDLDAKSAAEPSRRLAAAVQHELTSGIRARFGDVRDLGVKSALFYVLLGARMPAVLVETSFISNKVEERRLASSRFQEEVAAGVARALQGFAAAEARVAAR